MQRLLSIPYYAVLDMRCSVCLAGLKGVTYRDKVARTAGNMEDNARITLSGVRASSPANVSMQRVGSIKSSYGRLSNYTKALMGITMVITCIHSEHALL